MGGGGGRISSGGRGQSWCLMPRVLHGAPSLQGGVCVRHDRHPGASRAAYNEIMKAK